MRKPQTKSLFAIGSLLPQSAGTAVGAARGPRDAEPGITRHVLQDDPPAKTGRPLKNDAPDHIQSVAPAHKKPTLSHQEKIMAKTYKLGTQSYAILRALIDIGPLTTAGLDDTIGKGKSFIHNGCYQAGKLKLITKKDKLFHVTDAGRKAAAEAPGSFAEALKESAKAPAKKPAAAVLAIKKETAARAKPARIERSFVPCGPGPHIRAIKTLAGGMLVLEGTIVAFELSPAHVAEIVDAQAAS